jgi:hypothetical protein
MKTKPPVECDILIDPTATGLLYGSPYSVALCAALDAANGKARSFTVCSPATVAEIVQRAETHLGDNFVVRSEAIGAISTYSPPGPVANAYGNSAISTKITLTRCAKGWHLVRVERVPVHPRQAERFAVKPNDRATAAAVKRLLKNLGRTEVPHLVDA